MSYFPKDTKKLPILFVHIPKAAGTSVRKWYGKQYKKYHKCMHGSMSHPIIYNTSRTMPSFTIVRNPYDLVYSWYRYKRQMLDETRHKDPKELAAWEKGFEYWLERYKDKINFTKDNLTGDFNKISPMYSQLSYCRSTKGKISVDYILQLENLKKDWNIIKELTNSTIDLEIHNKSDLQKNYREAYTPATKKIVEQYYQEDLDFFNYSF